jgi:hypothetical protein
MARAVSRCVVNPLSFSSSAGAPWQAPEWMSELDRVDTVLRTTTPPVESDQA